MLRITPRRMLAAISGCGALLAPTCLTGCNIVGPAVVLLHGPEKTPRVHELAKERKTVVFIDDRSSRAPSKAVRLRIGKKADDVMLAEGVIAEGSLISSQSAIGVVSRERFGKPLSIAEIGESLGAEIVVHVTMDAFGLSEDGQSLTPSAAMRVKVFDVSSRTRQFPGEEKDWLPVEVRPRFSQGDLPKTTGARSEAEARLADEAGLAIARLFFDHINDDDPGPSQPRGTGG
ncbi:MAG: hypothetical protein JNM07_06865 [Phycisphaerae bacterium]|nr:hypothetical protein [Phycisphaerae bacterium]